MKATVCKLGAHSEAEKNSKPKEVWDFGNDRDDNRAKEESSEQAQSSSVQLWTMIRSLTSQEGAAEETALLGLLCDLHPLTAALRTVSLLEHTDSKSEGTHTL